MPTQPWVQTVVDFVGNGTTVVLATTFTPLSPTDMAPGSRGYRDWTTPTDRTLPDSSRLVLPRMSFDLGSGFVAFWLL